MNSDKKIVVTGATGSIGLDLPKTCISLKSRLESSDQDKMKELEGLGFVPDSFIHLAALTSVQACESDPEKAYQLNVEGALSWFRAAQQIKISCFLFVSTSHVYSKEACQSLLTVDSPTGPHSVYGKTKFEAEQKLQDLAEKNETQLRIARVFSVLSDHGSDWSLLKSLEKRAKNKDFSSIPGLSCKRDFLWSHEVCEKLMRIVHHYEELPQLLNVCSGRAQTVRDIANQVFSRYDLSAQEIKEKSVTPSPTLNILGKPSF